MLLRKGERRNCPCAVSLREQQTEALVREKNSGHQHCTLVGELFLHKTPSWWSMCHASHQLGTALLVISHQDPVTFRATPWGPEKRLNTTNPTVHHRFASDKAYSSSSPSFSNSDFLCELHPNCAKLKHAGGCYGFHYQHGHCFSTSTVYLFCGRSGAWSRVERDELL